jgi:putative membrane protein
MKVNKYYSRIIIVAFCLGAGAHYARARTAEDLSGGTAFAALSVAQNTLGKIHQTDLMEIEAGELAIEKGDSVLVRALGDRLSRDHRMAESMVMKTARDLGVVLPPTQPGESEIMASLVKSYARAFDQTYVGMMIEGHLRDISVLSETYDQLPPGAPMRLFLGKLLPILKQHLQVAMNVKPWI